MTDLRLPDPRAMPVRESYDGDATGPTGIRYQFVVWPMEGARVTVIGQPEGTGRLWGYAVQVLNRVFGLPRFSESVETPGVYVVHATAHDDEGGVHDPMSGVVQAASIQDAGREAAEQIENGTFGAREIRGKGSLLKSLWTSRRDERP